MIQMVKKKIKAGPAAALSTELTVHREWWWVLRSRNKASDGRNWLPRERSDSECALPEEGARELPDGEFPQAPPSLSPPHLWVNV